jgi:quercetin dioxygenase-like cupin family protein
MIRHAMAAFAAVLFLAQSGIAEQTGAHHDHIMLQAEELEWRDGPPSLPQGAQFVVIEGDPASEGIFTMRLKAPPGYRIPPHTHPKVERVTVIDGTFRLGMGSAFNEEELEDLPAGSFFVMPPGMQHFAAVCPEEGAVVQLTGQGPWDIIYVNPEDDPRRQERQAADRDQ